MQETSSREHRRSCIALGWPGIHYVTQAGLELTETSVSQVLPEDYLERVGNSFKRHLEPHQMPQWKESTESTKEVLQDEDD